MSVLLAGLSACGRKGDPVLITPDDKAGLERFVSDNYKESKRAE
jgi:predicted small lipoprotein YifL